MAVPPSQFQPEWAALAAPELTGPAVPTTAGRVCGADTFGGGSGALWMAACFCGGTEPVTSPDEAWVREPNRLYWNRCVSELQLTAATEIVARTARRNNLSERPGSSTQRIGCPTRTQQDDGRVNRARVNRCLRMKDSFNPNQTTPKFVQIEPLGRHNSRAWPGSSGTKRTPIRFSRDSPCPVLVSLTSSCPPPCGPIGSTMMPSSASCAISAGGMLSAAAVTMMRS